MYLVLDMYLLGRGEWLVKAEYEFVEDAVIFMNDLNIKAKEYRYGIIYKLESLNDG